MAEMLNNYANGQSVRESLIAMQRRAMAAAMGVASEYVDYFVQTGFRNPSEAGDTRADTEQRSNVVSVAEYQRRAAHVGSIAATVISAGTLSQVNPEAARAAGL